MTVCRYGRECRAFQRLSNRGDRLDDRCHVRLYDHPARDRYDKLPEGYSPFVYRSEWRHEITDAPVRGLSSEHELSRLIDEVKRNGYGDDLVTADGDSLLTVVDRKLEHPRCKQIQAELAKKAEKEKGSTIPMPELYSPLTRAHMLAVILYTGCDSNYAMCAAERKGDYETWPWFSFLLRDALDRLWSGGKEGDSGVITYSGEPKPLSLSSSLFSFLYLLGILSYHRSS